MKGHLFCVFLLCFMKNVYSSDEELRSAVEQPVLNASSYVYWPNATVPFYIEDSNFDAEQFIAIMQALSLFADKTCIKFLPLLVPPTQGQHVMWFVNPKGIRKCVFNTDGHSMEGGHQIVMGYDCLTSEKQIQMVIMKSLGFGFEHNRPVRDLFIEIQPENIEPGSLELFTKDNRIPMQLHSLPYDANSVMHFGERDYSKNGHKTIRFKNSKTHQHHEGLSPMDIRKIQVVYGPECLKRERQEKKEICQSYPGAARKKRNANAYPTDHTKQYLRQKRNVEAVTNLRVNRDITPRPIDIHESIVTNDIVTGLDLKNEIEEIVDSVYKFNTLALEKARVKYCNSSKPMEIKLSVNATNGSGIANVISVVANYTKSVIDSAMQNLTLFCKEAMSPEIYQRVRCEYYKNKKDCGRYIRQKSTKVGHVVHSTQHQPPHFYPTRHDGNPHKYNYLPLRSGDGYQEARIKRSFGDSSRSPMRRKNRDDNESNSEESEEDTKKQPSDENEPSEEIAKIPRTVALSKENTEFYKDRKWPGGVVRYIIEDVPNYDTDDLRSRLSEVNSILKQKTCVHIEEIRTSDTKRYADHLIINNSPDYVTGRVGGAQKFGAIELFQGGQHRQHTAMMVMAMLGFYFEISRHDRDKYIRVHTRHVRADKLHHFEKIRKEATLALPYDYKSSTHPAWQFWRKIGRTGISTVATLKTRDPDGSIMKKLGQNEKLLSDIDIVKINSVYGIKCLQKKGKERKENVKRKEKQRKQDLQESEEEPTSMKQDRHESSSRGSSGSDS